MPLLLGAAALALGVPFPQRPHGDFPPRPAKRVCLDCESLVPCLSFALVGAVAVCGVFVCVGSW